MATGENFYNSTKKTKVSHSPKMYHQAGAVLENVMTRADVYFEKQNINDLKANRKIAAQRNFSPKRIPKEIRTRNSFFKLSVVHEQNEEMCHFLASTY